MTEPEPWYPEGYTAEQKARLDEQRRVAREYREREITITLTGEEWQEILAATYRALLKDAETVTKADRGELPESEDDLDPLMLLDVIARTYRVREKLHDLMHQGEDQASWTPNEED